MCLSTSPRHRLRIPLHTVKRLIEEYLVATDVLIAHVETCEKCSSPEPEDFCETAKPLYAAYKTASMRERLCPHNTYEDVDSNPDLPQELLSNSSL